LREHRLELAPAALFEGAVTVPEVATRFGFYQFGPFAAAYRALFDETPTATRCKI
jgi:transcriptional regulator GlxA family with amidase domain